MVKMRRVNCVKDIYSSSWFVFLRLESANLSTKILTHTTSHELGP